MTDTPQNPGAIAEYHAHVYYDGASKDRAAQLRAWVEERFPAEAGMRMGRWHDTPVGPHVQAMYQIAFAPSLFPTLAPFLMMNRLGLTILLHPESGRPRDDHTKHAVWMGAVLSLKAELLPEVG